MTEKTNQFWFMRYKLSLFLITSTFILILIHVVFFRNFSYKSGLAGNAFYYFGLLLWSLPVESLLLIAFIISLIHFLCAIIKSLKIKQYKWLRILLALCPAILTLIYLGSVIFPLEPGVYEFLRGYEKWVEKEVDIPTIQQWLASLPEEYSGQYYFEATGFPEPLPEAITKLDPYHMEFSEFKDGIRSVEFEWGCALDHWGIIIGLPGMETPKEEECIKLHESEWEYRRPIQSGVYIFDRG